MAGGAGEAWRWRTRSLRPPPGSLPDSAPRRTTSSGGGSIVDAVDTPSSSQSRNIARIALGSFLAFAGIVLSPAAGAVMMSASTIAVALNAQMLRLLRLNPADLG